MAKFVQLKDTQTGEAIYPITALPNEFTNEDIEAICDFEEGMDEDDVIPKATKDLLGCVVVGDGLDVDDSGVLSNGWDWELLWENASPTSAFGAQTINLDLSEYDGIEILYYTWTTELCLLSTGFIPKDTEKSRLIAPIDYNWDRDITAITNSGVTFGIAKAYTTYGNSTSIAENNSACIPYQIYGIKGVS